MSNLIRFALCFSIGFVGSAILRSFTLGMSHTSTVLIAVVGGYVMGAICSAIGQGVQVSK